ncbi:hypothetical protein FACS1894105_02670 [Clostridia bacterium]|nr:hypothetical protein FACS1894105_02670 [Clostridia bacterium]
MNEIVQIKNGDVFTTSQIIASGAGVEHRSVIRLIETHEARLSKYSNVRFTDFKSVNLQGGRPEKMCFLNEIQATLILTFMRNTETVTDFKVALVEEFFAMRKFLLHKQTAVWQEARILGKKSRLLETDVILNKLIPLAVSQSCTHPEMLYMTYTKLINTTLEITAGMRDSLPYTHLRAVDFMENAIQNIIADEVVKGTHYKEIYTICKVKCGILKDLSFLPTSPQIAEITA